MLDEVKDVDSSSLYLELLEAHGDILLPYCVGSYMIGEFAALENGTVHALTAENGVIAELCILRHIEEIEVAVGKFLYMLGVGELFSADDAVVLRAELAPGVAAGIHEELALFLVAYFFESLEVVVEVVVDNDDMVVLVELIVELVRLGYAFAGRACELVIGVILADILLEHRRRDYDLVHPVVSEVHDEVAEVIGEVFFLDERICKRESQGDTAVIEGFDDGFDEVLVANPVLETPSVPYGRGEGAVNGSNFYAFAEVFGEVFQHFGEDDIEAVVLAEIRKMKTCFHNSSLSVGKSAAVFEGFQQSETRLIAAFGFSHIVHIGLEDIERTCGTSLYLELLKAHRHVFIPDIVGRDMSPEPADIEDTALRVGTVAEVLRVVLIGIKGHTGVFFDMLVVGYLLLADAAVVSASARAAGLAAGIYEKLAVLLAWELFEDIEIVVEVVIDNDDAVVLAELLIELIGVGDTLAGRACELVLRVVFADIVLEKRGHDYCLVEPVICEVHDHIAERVGEVFFLESGVSEGESQGDTALIEGLEHLFDEGAVTDAALSASAVPY